MTGVESPTESGKGLMRQVFVGLWFFICALNWVTGLAMWWSGDQRSKLYITAAIACLALARTYQMEKP
jgi:hypothetical protein